MNISNLTIQRMLTSGESETLVNAIVHRDYTNHSDIQIKIFDNQITFFSPGKLYGGLTVDDLNTDTYQSRTRNKLVAEAFYLTNNIEKYGSGFVRIRKELTSYPEVAFEIREVGDGVLLTFAQNEGVNERVNGLFNFIAAHPGYRLPEISQYLKTPAKTVERWLKQLRYKGKIEYKGSPRKGGYFIVNSSAEMNTQ